MRRVVKKKKKGTKIPQKELDFEEPDPNAPQVHGLRDIRVARAQQKYNNDEEQKQAQKLAKQNAKKPGVSAIRQAGAAKASPTRKK